MDNLTIFIILFVLLAIITLIGHGVWVFIAWVLRTVGGRDNRPGVQTLSLSTAASHHCSNCGVALTAQMRFCGVCGAHRPTLAQEEQLRELGITLRQLDRLHQAGEYQPDFTDLKHVLELERERILFPQGRPRKAPAPPSTAPQPQTPARPQTEAKPVEPLKAAPPPFITPTTFEDAPGEAPRFGEWSKDSDEAELPPPVPKVPRKPFADVLAAFMEQSNVRWGEIIGGLLIIGCSTALVISLWAQISRVPMIKFMIFTTVTAALFGIGFYTAHHWKLPTTSRGILTIATLLVPLNFLAIAAVSTNTTPGVLVIGSEIIAPVLFLCLVYFAGRTITTKWPHLLAAGALGSSVGQLLIRHFATSDISPNWLIILAAFPVACYVGATGWMLKLALADGEIDETEATEIFTALGALTFATILPFGLLLYKSASVATAMMHLAPLVTLAGMPPLATGMFLWRRSAKELAASRTAGASIAILGMIVALAGMILAWPNPASVIPAALFNFVLFTAVAVFLDEPRAHVIAAGCLSLGYVIGFHVIAGRVPWENLRVISLLQVTASARTGQALALPFIAFLLVHEWLTSRRDRDAVSYLLASCGIAVVSLGFLVVFGLGRAGDPFLVSAFLALYAGGAFWFAWRRKLVGFSWAGSALLFGAAAQICNSLLALRFPWQASCLVFALVCVGGAIAAQRLTKTETARLFVLPLQASSIVGSAFAALWLIIQLILFDCEPASVFATRAFILAVVLLGLFWLDGSAIFFAGLQMALALAAVLLTKFILQRFDWYAFRPDAWADPRALQVQGIVLALMCLAWVGVRLVLRKFFQATEPGRLRRIATGMAFDHLLSAALLFGFVILLLYGSATGIGYELTNPARAPATYDFAGHPHALIFGVGSLLLLVVLLAVMIGNAIEHRRGAFVLGAWLALWCACPLVAGRFEPQVATASAGRWAVAIFLLIASILYAFRDNLWRGQLNEYPISTQAGRALLLFLTLGPLLLLTLSPTANAIRYTPAPGPQSGIFRAIGGVALYGVPLMLAVIALGIHAALERSAAFAFAAALLVNFTVTVVHINAVAGLHGSMNEVVLVNSLQLNAIASAGVALIWIATREWWLRPLAVGEREAPTPTSVFADAGAAGKLDQAPANDAISPSASISRDAVARALLTCQITFAVAFNTLVIVPLLLHMIAFPDRVGLATFAGGRFTGWLALFFTIAAVIGFHKASAKAIRFAGLAAALLAVGALISFRLAPLGVANWAGFHILLAMLAVIAWLLLAARNLPRQPTLARALAAMGAPFADGWAFDGESFTAGVGLAAVLVALRAPFADPAGGWWSIAVLLAMSALAASLNWITFRRGYLYAAGGLFNVAVSIWLIEYGRQPGTLAGLVEANIIALSLAGILWLLLELRSRRVAGKRSSPASFHNIAALASLAAMTIVVGGHLYNDLGEFYQTFLPWIDLMTLASLAALMLACLWDRDAEYAVAAIYLIGLLSATTAIHHIQLAPRNLFWSLTLAAAAQAIVAAVLWRLRRPLMAAAGRLKIPDRLNGNAGHLAWLLIFNAIVVAAVVVLVLWMDVVFGNWSLRAIASAAVIAQTLTFGLLAEGPRRRALQHTAVAVFLVGLVFLGWAFLTPGDSGTWLNRAVILMIVMFAAVALFGAGVVKLGEREPDWTIAIRDCVPATAVAGIVALVFILSGEIYYQIEFGAVQVNLWAVAAVGVTLATAAIVCIFFAVSPKHDPLALADRWRGSYVYAAEVLVVLLFMHIRLTMPWLFHGFFQRYWPLVILVIAYAGVAISEFFKRRQVPVLATPIERTGAFLPLLPVIGFWIAASQVEYSTLLFVVGGLYGLLAILRRSFFFGLAAALAGNGGLWYLLHETSDYHFYQHPQLWLIPAAISVLVAAHLNRKDFSESQMTGIRYMCLATIYVSSTADIFINGVATSPWLPLVLAALSLAGVFAGMIFRIRAFLLLGSLFLLLAIATMIKYASVNFGWTWLWYVAGIVTGAAIITTFAIFEKQRADVMRLVEEFKEWKG
jgi:hypothetical protein